MRAPARWVPVAIRAPVGDCAYAIITAQRELGCYSTIASLVASMARNLE